MILNNLKRNIYYKNQHLLARNNYSKFNYYVTNETLDMNKSKELFKMQNNWEDIISDDSLLYSIERMDVKYQQILWLLIVEQATQKEISKSMNVSQQSVSKTRKLILKKLKRTLVRNEKNYE